MTEGTSQGLFVVVAIVIFGIFVGLSYNLFGKTLQPAMVNMFETALKIDGGEGEGPITPPVAEEVVFFEDKNLEAAIKKWLSIPADKDVTVNKLGQVRYLNLLDENIKSVVGLEHAVSLDSLTLRDNEITDIKPLANLTNLTYLDIAENEITDIKPLANLTNLEGLVIYRNQITDIKPLANLKKLKKITMFSNPITDFSILDTLPNLIEIEK